MSITEITIDGTRYEVKAIPNQPASHTPAPEAYTAVREEAEKVEVLNVSKGTSLGGAELPVGYYHKFCLSRAIPEEKFDSIKKAIEFVLNPSSSTPASEPKDWEIESYKNKNTLEVFTKYSVRNNSYYSEGFDDFTGGFKRQDVFEIDSVKRLSDNTVWAADEIVSTNNGRGEHKIDGFKIIDGKMCVWMKSFPTEYEFLSRIQKLPPKPLAVNPVIIDNENMCNICGGQMVFIRGKYPNEDKRKVCPTCAVERLESINEMSSKNYGQTCQSKQSIK